MGKGPYPPNKKYLPERKVGGKGRRVQTKGRKKGNGTELSTSKEGRGARTGGLNQ